MAPLFYVPGLDCTVAGLSAPENGSLDDACREGAELYSGQSCQLTCDIGYNRSGTQPSCSRWAGEFDAGSITCNANGNAPQWDPSNGSDSTWAAAKKALEGTTYPVVQQYLQLASGDSVDHDCMIESFGGHGCSQLYKESSHMTVEPDSGAGTLLASLTSSAVLVGGVDTGRPWTRVTTEYDHATSDSMWKRVFGTSPTTTIICTYEYDDEEDFAALTSLCDGRGGDESDPGWSACINQHANCQIFNQKGDEMLTCGNAICGQREGTMACLVGRNRHAKECVRPEQ